MLQQFIYARLLFLRRSNSLLVLHGAQNQTQATRKDMTYLWCSLKRAQVKRSSSALTIMPAEYKGIICVSLSRTVLSE
jgi:hypothetical protein